MKKDYQPLKKGRFDKETMTVYFGGQNSKPEFIFTAIAIHCPSYTYQVLERESLGNGWYGAQKEVVTKTADRNYLVVKDGVCIGVLYDPYVVHNIKSDLYPIDEKTPQPIINFFKSLKIHYQHYISNKIPLPKNY